MLLLGSNRRRMAYRRVLNLVRLLSLPRLRPLVPSLSQPTQLSRPLPALPRYLSSDTTGPDRASASREDSEINTRIRHLINCDKVVVFMKGSPDSPMCGFSKKVVQILHIHGVQFSSFDVLQEASLRQGIKDFTGWPTIPQVFFSGELVGGVDIVSSMHQKEELPAELDKIGIKSRLAPLNK